MRNGERETTGDDGWTEDCLMLVRGSGNSGALVTAVVDNFPQVWALFQHAESWIPYFETMQECSLFQFILSEPQGRGRSHLSDVIHSYSNRRLYN